MNKTLFILFLFMMFSSKAWATTINAASCSNASFVTAIGTAVSGDTVLGPGGTNTGGGTRLDIPSTKGITVDGGGCTINWGFGLTTNATTGTRITNFTFTRNGDNTEQNASFKTLGTSLTNARWRVDHCTFTGSGSNIVEFGPEPGLFDHNTFNGGGNSDEQLHAMGWGASDDTGWTTAMPSTGSRAAGTDQAVILEDNVFSASSYSNTHATFMESFYGARVITRFNTFNFYKSDFHGGGGIGGRWWEFYYNDFHTNLPAADGGDSIILRDGSGIIFGNTRSGTTTSQPNIGACTESGSAYPAPYQIGRGTGSSGSQVLDQAFMWNNAQTITLNDTEAQCNSGAPLHVQFNRDVYTDVNSASCTGGGSCTSGVGIGTVLPTSCTVGVGFWKTNEGSWNAGTNPVYTGQGVLYKCTSTNTFTLYYTPYTYPDPLIGGSCVPSKLTYMSQPSNAQQGNTLGTISVAVQDSGGVTCTSDTSTVTLAKKGGTCTGMTLNGTVSGSAVAGVFTTSNVYMTVGTGSCTLTATDGALTSADSSSFTITAIPTGAGGSKIHGR